MSDISPDPALSVTAQPAGLRWPRPGARVHGGDTRALGLLGAGALAGLVATGALLAASGAQRLDFYLPAARHRFPEWLAGPLRALHLTLSPPTAALLLIAMLACYGVALSCVRAVPARWGLGAVALLHLAFLLAPPLFSADVFGYLDYARLGVLHHLSPYLHGAAAAPHDPVVPFVRWHSIPTPYGPVFTLLTYPLALVGVPAGLWVLKVVAVAASLGCVGLVWRIAQRLGREPLPAALFVGLNPLWLAYGVGGAHNDLLLMAVVLGGVLLAVAGRPAGGGAGLVLAAAMKASAGLVFPFALLGSGRRGRLVAGAVIAAAVVAAIAWLGFGADGFRFVGQIDNQQRLVSSYSVPSELALLLGLGTVTAGLRAVLGVALAAAIVWLLWRTWRGADWIAAAGWATLALLLTTAWLVPWYVVWLLPLAAVGGDRRLRGVTLAFCAYVTATRVAYLLA